MPDPVRYFPRGDLVGEDFCIGSKNAGLIQPDVGFLSASSKVPSVPPDPWDRWDEETPSKKELADAE